MTSPNLSEPVITHRSPSVQSQLLYWGARGTVRHVYRSWPLTDVGLRGLALVEGGFSRLRHPTGVSLASSALGAVPVVTFTPDAAAVPGAALADVSVLYLHGGAFVFCGPGTHRPLCAGLSVRLGATVHAVRYRLLPEVDLDGIVQDAYDAYRALAEALPATHRIVVAGDSAGGFLAAKLCELAALDGIRRPDALVGYSPLLDLDAEVSEGTWWHRDAFQPASTVRRAQAVWHEQAHDMRGARSMLDVDPRSFPPALITLAAGELVEAPALQFTATLHAAGRPVQTHRWYSTVHAFPVLAGLTRESHQAIDLTLDFLQDVPRRL